MILEKKNTTDFVENLIDEFKILDITKLVDDSIEINDYENMVVFYFRFSLIENIYQVSINHYYKNTASSSMYSKNTLLEIREVFINYLKTSCPKHYKKYKKSIRMKKIHNILH